MGKEMRREKKPEKSLISILSNGTELVHSHPQYSKRVSQNWGRFVNGHSRFLAQKYRGRNEDRNDQWWSDDHSPLPWNIVIDEDWADDGSEQSEHFMYFFLYFSTNGRSWLKLSVVPFYVGTGKILTMQ